LIYNTVQNLGVSKFKKKLKEVSSPRHCLFDQKYSKNINIVKYYWIYSTVLIRIICLLGKYDQRWL